MVLVNFTACPLGRLIQIIIGISLIGIGMLVIEGTGGKALAVVGIVPLLAAICDICVLAPFFGASFDGAENRRQAGNSSYLAGRSFLFHIGGFLFVKSRLFG